MSPVPSLSGRKIVKAFEQGPGQRLPGIGAGELQIRLHILGRQGRICHQEVGKEPLGGVLPDFSLLRPDIVEDLVLGQIGREPAAIG